jgi:hypothetical protein
MQLLRTKSGLNLKVVSILGIPKTIGKPDIIFVCIDKDYKPVTVTFEEIETLGK